MADPGRERTGNVREIVFALEFRGEAGAAPDGTRRARSSAPSQSLVTVLGAGGVECRVDELAGERAVLQSRVERFPDGTFVEDGTIAYGTAGSVMFVTVGRGVVRPSALPGWQHGAVAWTITGGDGRFAGATGLITSNFVVSASGAVVDHHVARLYLPS